MRREVEWLRPSGAMAIELSRSVSSTATVDGSSLVVRPREAGAYERIGKRILDLTLASFMVLLLLPVLVAVGLLLRMTIGREVLFRQERVGKNGHTFLCLKFRTMRPDRRRADRPYEGVDRRTGELRHDDPRHTAVGRLLRRYSLDELPQLLNVVRGDMSLVGPRPEMVSRASEEFVTHPRHWVRPGLTGPYQVSELRLAGDLNAGLRQDSEYVGSVTLRRDLGLLLKTAAVVVLGTGR